MFSRKLNLFLWVGFHVIIFIIFLFSGPKAIETSLYSILPDTNPVKNIAKVEQKNSNKVNSNMTVLIGSKNFSALKDISRQFADNLENIAGIEDIQYKISATSLGKIQQYLHKYRYHILTPDVRSILEEGNGQALKERAYFTLSSPVSMGSLDFLDEDPFLLTGDALQYFTSTGIPGNMALSVKDSLLTREWEGKYWVLISFRSSLSGDVVDVEGNPVPYIHNAAQKLMDQYDDAEFLFSGVPFHSWDSARKSKFEISLMSTISTLFIILMIILVFRSFKPLIAVVTAIVTGMLTGLAVTLIIFNEIHIFTIVFGTSLIGISVDYSFHFFTEWAEGKRSRSVVRRIFPGITIGLITTLLSYGAFTLTTFPLLQQMALFSIAGLVSTYFSVLFLYGNIKSASSQTKLSTHRTVAVIKKISGFTMALPAWSKTAILFLLAVLAFWGIKDLELNNNVRDLYTMSDQLFQWEKKSSQILAHGSSGVYFMIEGTDLEDNLRKEEALKRELDGLVKAGKLESQLSLSSLMPSKKIQKENLELVEKSLFPLMENQLLFLGFGSDQFKENYSRFEAAKDTFIDEKDLYSLPLNSLIDTLQTGVVGGRYYTSILLFGISDLKALKELASGHDGVYLINKIDDISRTLGDLSHLALLIIAFSYGAILIGLSFRYGIKKAISVVLIPAIASLCSLSIVSLLNMPINLFVIVGLILIPGMGTDYIILIKESDIEDYPVLLSITLSMMTSVLAFGLLGLTSIAGVFGTTVASGVFLTWCITMLFGNREKGDQL